MSVLFVVICWIVFCLLDGFLLVCLIFVNLFDICFVFVFMFVWVWVWVWLVLSMVNMFLVVVMFFDVVWNCIFIWWIGRNVFGVSSSMNSLILSVRLFDSSWNLIDIVISVIVIEVSSFMVKFDRNENWSIFMVLWWYFLVVILMWLVVLWLCLNSCSVDSFCIVLVKWVVSCCSVCYCWVCMVWVVILIRIRNSGISGSVIMVVKLLG